MQNIEYGRENELLVKLLRSVDRPGSYCIGDKLFLPMPCIAVDGIGELSFPVRKAQIDDLIKVSQHAPYGQGTQTFVDTKVRDCLQIDADRVSLGGRAWETSFSQIMKLVSEGLGLADSQLAAEFYKLLVYRQGGFFAAHRDTEKVPGMVATLSMSLPTAGEGGELVIRHGDGETVFDMRAKEPSELAFAAFYADCVHEVRAVTGGHRISLVFNLFIRSGRNWATAPDYSGLTDQVADCLAVWKNRGTTEKLVWVLDHEYSEDGLSFDTLKNTDSAVAQVLAEAAERAHCDIYAAVLHIDETGVPEIEPDHRSGYSPEPAEMRMGELVMQGEQLAGWAARDGSEPPFRILSVHPGEIHPPDALADAVPDEVRLQEYTANEGPTLDRFYHFGALVVWPRERTVDFAAKCGIDGAVSWVSGQCALVDDTELRRLLARLTDLWPMPRYGPGLTDRPAMLRLLHDCGHPDLAAEFLERVLLQHYDGSENDSLSAVLALVGTNAAGSFLPRLVKKHMAQHPRGVIVLLAMTKEVSGDAFPAWRDVLLEGMQAALAGLRSALKAQSSTCVVSNERGTRIETLRPELSLADRLDYQAVRELFVLALRLLPAEQSILAARTIIEFPKAVPPERMLAQALIDLFDVEDMARTETYRLLWRHAVDCLLQRSEWPPSQPMDWAFDVEIPCPCNHCTILRNFCEDPDEKAKHFKLRKDLRTHLREIIVRYVPGLDYTTVRRGSPYSLIVNKTQVGIEHKLFEYEKDVESIRLMLACAVKDPSDTADRERVQRLSQAEQAARYYWSAN